MNALRIALILSALPAGLHAQENQIMRRAWDFFERQLTIEVVTDAPGELQVIRSREARIEVAANAGAGVAAAVLGGWRHDELTLTAAGAERAVYIVTVPERSSVLIRLPGRGDQLLQPRPVQSFHWDGRAPAQASEEAGAAGGAIVPLLPPNADGMYVTFSAAKAPAVIRVESLESVTSLSVRFAYGDFRIAAPRPLSLIRGTSDDVTLRLDGPAQNLVLDIPRFTAHLTIIADGREILRVRNGSVEKPCGPLVDQTLDNDRRWIELTPRDGRLICA